MVESKKHTPTLKDIARNLNLSISTVSRALSDHPAIRQETKDIVNEEARKLEYYPDSVARSLQQKSTRTIGVIVPEIRHFFFSSAVDGIEDIAYQAGYTILVSKSNEDCEREILNTRSLVSNKVAGIIASVAQNTTDGSHFSSLANRNIPLVFFDRVLDDVDANKVVVDDFVGAYQSTRHLIEAGYRRIAHIAGPDHLKIARERLNGYRQALEEGGCEFCEELIVRVELDEQHGAEAVGELLDRDNPPDAIFAVNDPVAVGAHKEIRARGLNIPNDIGITGFSNNPVTEMIEPQLTTIDQHGYRMGQVAARLLLDEIEKGAGNIAHETRVVETELLIRGSSQRQRGRHE